MGKKTAKNNKNQKKEMTINDLAVAINNLSERMDKRFDEIDDRFVEVDKRFGDVDDRFSKIDNRLARVDGRFSKMEISIGKRFKEQEIKLEKMMDDKIEDLAVMINRSFEKVATKDEVNLLREDMNKNFDKVNDTVEKISIKPDNLADKVYADHNPRIVNLENKMQKLESAA
ncbi:MAG: hypothetical protein L6Q29_03685 [Candidatus Pacebacteria bacterium]|nr:hypothetical protein [Candidatus Paceibacterota bacterium]NUQ57645.1 hypothetical protein [Candidatus Paceibacter sp.]